MKIYNTMSKQVEEFIPREEGIINILSAYGQSVGGETHEQNENNGS